MAHHCMLDRVLDRIIMLIDIEKFDNTEIFIDTDDKLSEDATLKNVVILMTCVIKDNGKIYSQLFLGEALFFNKTRDKKEVESVLIMKSSISSG